jgi:hypothetical protein
VLFQAGLDPALQGQLFDLITAMINDFDSRWGSEVRYNSRTVRAARNRQIGIPTYSFWAMALDPRTKKKLSKVLSDVDIMKLWSDIHGAVLSIVEGLAAIVDVNDETNTSTAPIVARGRPRSINKREYCFIAGSSDEEDEAVLSENVPLTLIVEDELKRFKSFRGIPLISQDSTFSCPLLWWKKNHKSYPNVWELAQRVLSIPATSAPSERVFSAAANVVDKNMFAWTPIQSIY